MLSKHTFPGKRADAAWRWLSPGCFLSKGMYRCSLYPIYDYTAYFQPCDHSSRVVCAHVYQCWELCHEPGNLGWGEGRVGWGGGSANREVWQVGWGMHLQGLVGLWGRSRI